MLQHVGYVTIGKDLVIESEAEKNENKSNAGIKIWRLIEAVIQNKIWIDVLKSEKSDTWFCIIQFKTFDIDHNELKNEFEGSIKTTNYHCSKVLNEKVPSV